MFSPIQNIIILIDLQEPKNTKAYTSLVKLCKSNPDFPLHELRRREKYVYPFIKGIKGKQYMFVKNQINQVCNELKLSTIMLEDSGFAKLTHDIYRFGNVYICKKENTFLYYEKSDDDSILYSKYFDFVIQLKTIFSARKGIELQININ